MSELEKRDPRGGWRGFICCWPELAFFMPLIMFLSSVVGDVPMLEPWDEAMELSLMRRCWLPGISMLSDWEVELVFEAREGRRSTGFKG